MSRALNVLDADAAVPAAGQLAPDFELPDSTGSFHRLSELVAQRPIILFFYRGHW